MTKATVHDLIPEFDSYVHDMEQNLKMDGEDSTDWQDYLANPVPYVTDLLLDFGDWTKFVDEDYRVTAQMAAKKWAGQEDSDDVAE
jgi:hypothetical protein